ncbi:MAG TPA: MFS transporter [Blastocatellia bacterium]|nr:MFS transporter [Blastocatellia bacterium]
MKEVRLEQIRRWSLLQPLAVRNFRFLFLGHCGSILGDQFYLIALPWLVFSLTGSSLMLGTVLLVAGAVRSTFLLMGGALSDRFSPRVLMLTAYGIGALVTSLTALAVHLNVTERWHLFLLGGCFGLVEATFFPAYQSVTPRIISRERLVAGNSLLRSAVRLMGIIGPALAGVVIGKNHFTAAFAFDAASFVFAFTMISMIRIEPTADAGADTNRQSHAAPRQPLLRSIGEGLSYALRHRPVRALLVYMIGFEFAAASANHIGLPAFARLHFGQEAGARALGAMASSVAAGLLIGMLLAGSMNAFKREDRVTTLMTLLMVCALSALAFASTLLPACAALLAFGVASGAVSIIIQSRIQMTSEKRMLGRVMSILMLCVSLAEMAGFALSGVLADVNLRLVFLLSGLVMGLTLLVWMSSRRRLEATPDAEP